MTEVNYTEAKSMILRKDGADAFAAALAKKLKAELVTGDAEFNALEKEIKVNWLT